MLSISLQICVKLMAPRKVTQVLDYFIYIYMYVCIYTRTYIRVIYMLYMFIYIYVCIYDISKHSSSGKSYAWMRVIMNRSFKGLIPLPRLI